MQNTSSTKTPLKIATKRRCSGITATARLIGCSAGHLTYIMHGHRKANPILKRRLARMGITTTVDGEKL